MIQVKTLALAAVLAAALPAFSATSKTVSGGASRPKAAAHERTVTLDARDEEVRAVLGSMQQQCGVRNLVVDPGVQGRGTFFFHALPCSTAFRAVFETLGLDAAPWDGNVMAVEKRR